MTAEQSRLYVQQLKSVERQIRHQLKNGLCH